MLAVAFVLFSFNLFQVGAPACLPNPRSLSQRRNVTHDGESYPIGLWVNDWDAAYVTSGVVHILIEDFWEPCARLSVSKTSREWALARSCWATMS